MSNLQGALLGQAVVESDKPGVFSSLVGTKNTANVAVLWDSYLKTSGAVTHGKPGVRAVLHGDAIRYWDGGRYTGPNPLTPAAALRIERKDSPAHRCLCNGTVPKAGYSYRPGSSL